MKLRAKLPPDAEKPDLDNFKLWRPVPSEEAPFGYKGRVVIMEQLVVTEEIQRFIRGDVQDVHPETIEETARHEGMLTLARRNDARGSRASDLNNYAGHCFDDTLIEWRWNNLVGGRIID